MDKEAIDNLETINKTSKENDAIVKQTNEDYKDQQSIVSKISDNLSKITDNLKTAGSLFGTAFALKGITEISRQMWDMDKTMQKLSARMGNASKGVDGIKKGAKELSSEVTNLQKKYGATYDTAKNIVEVLAKGNLNGNMREAASGAELFSDAAGVGAEQVANLTRNLNVNGKMSVKSINSMYAGMLKVQQTAGLTDQGMEAVTNQIEEASINMKIFGKTDKEIASMGVNTTKLAAGLEKVGISAQQAMEFVNKLTDPDRIEDNIGLYAQLGVSMSDVLSGNIDMSSELMSGKMQELGQRIKGMGMIAGGEFARSLGLSYKEASKMAEADFSQAADATAAPEDKALEGLEKMTKATDNFTSKIDKFFNKLEGLINSIPPIILSAIGIIVLVGTNAFKKIRKQSSASTEEMRKDITTTSEYFSNSISDASSKASKSVEGISDSISSIGNGNDIKGISDGIGLISDTSSKASKSVEGVSDSIGKANKSSNNLYSSIGEIGSAYSVSMNDVSGKSKNLITEISSSMEKTLDGTEKIVSQVSSHTVDTMDSVNSNMLDTVDFGNDVSKKINDITTEMISIGDNTKSSMISIKDGIVKLNESTCSGMNNTEKAMLSLEKTSFEASGTSATNISALNKSFDDGIHKYSTLEDMANNLDLGSPILDFNEDIVSGVKNAEKSFNNLGIQASASTEKIGGGIVSSLKNTFLKTFDLASSTSRKIGNTIKGNASGIMKEIYGDTFETYNKLAKEINVGWKSRISTVLGTPGSVLTGVFGKHLKGEDKTDENGIKTKKYATSLIGRAATKNTDNSIIQAGKEASAKMSSIVSVIQDLDSKMIEAQNNNNDDLVKQLNGMKASIIEAGKNKYGGDFTGQKVKSVSDMAITGMDIANGAKSKKNASAEEIKFSRMSKQGYDEIMNQLVKENSEKKRVNASSIKDLEAQKKYHEFIATSNKATAKEQADALLAISKINKSMGDLNAEAVELGKESEKIQKAKGSNSGKLYDETQHSGIANFARSKITNVKNKATDFYHGLQERGGRSANGTLNFGSAVKGVGKNALSGIGGILKGVGSSLKGMLGPVAIISLLMKLLQPAIERIQPMLEEVYKAFSDQLQPVFDILVGVFKQLQPIFTTIVKSIGNLLCKLIQSLLPVIIKSLGLILTILSPIQKVLGFVLKALGKIPGLGFLGDLGDAVSGLADIGPELLKMDMNQTQEIGKNTDALNNNTSEKPKVVLDNGGAKYETQMAANSSVASTSTAEQPVASNNITSTSSNVGGYTDDDKKALISQFTTLNENTVLNLKKIDNLDRKYRQMYDLISSVTTSGTIGPTGKSATSSVSISIGNALTGNDISEKFK